MSQPTVLELCAGYNGLGMAVEEVFGARTVAFSEFDAAPSKILAHHYPDVPNYGDMTKIDWAAIEQVDIISGGTPCQDLSAAGARRGMNEGTRSNLWVQMREAVAIQRPKYVVWENVRGAFSACASSEMGQCQGCVDGRGAHKPFLRALGRVLGDLSDLGYDCQWRGLRAADVGACHGRFRVFVLAQNTNLSTGGERRIAAPGQAQGGRTWPNPGGRDRTLAADTERLRSERRGGHGDLAGPTGASQAHGEERERDGYAVDHRRATTADTHGGNDAGRLRDAERHQEWREATSGCGEGLGTTPDALRLGGRGGPTESEQARGNDAALGSNQGGTNWGEYEPAIRRWERTIGRAAPRPTEPTGRNNGHRLSPRFTEWMMGLPDGWVTDPAIGISRNEQLKACGNGVVPQQAIAALQDMLAAFQTSEVAA